MGIRLGIAQINVMDLAQAKEFYANRLGFTCREVFGPGAPFLIEIEGGPRVLVYRATKQAPNDYPAQTGTTLVFHTDDIGATVERWRSSGVEFIPIAWSRDDSGIADCPFGRFIAFRDPSGNIHELLEPYPESDMPAWETGVSA